MAEDYVLVLEREVVRLTRRSHLPLWIFSVCFGGLFLVAWLHHAYPQAPVPFVLEAR